MNKLILKFALFIAILSFQLAAEDLSFKEKENILQALKDKISSQYVLEDNIATIVDALSTLQTSNEYKQAKTRKEFAKTLATTVREYDGHFSVLWSDPSKGKAQNKDYEGWFPMLSRKNSGFTKVEVLKGNIGYIDFWGFDNLNESAKAKAKAVLAFVEDTNAVIFDLRKNGGGSAVMLQFISSHFFQNKTHLNSFYNRVTGELTEFWTFDNIEGKKREKVPIYILTSDFTFSAAEEFAYNFKNLKRATIIGEPTGGGANPINVIDLGNGFRASIPVSKAVNPITNSNWEGVGVQPNIVIDSDKAFDLAYKLALETIIPDIKNPYQVKDINEQIQMIDNVVAHE